MVCLVIAVLRDADGASCRRICKPAIRICRAALCRGLPRSAQAICRRVVRRDLVRECRFSGFEVCEGLAPSFCQ